MENFATRTTFIHSEFLTFFRATRYSSFVIRKIRASQKRPVYPHLSANYRALRFLYTTATTIKPTCPTFGQTRTLRKSQNPQKARTSSFLDFGEIGIDEVETLG